jgi:natural product precursor
MKKRLEKKLSLSKETLRNLSEKDMKDAVGGYTRFVGCSDGTCISDCDTCTQSCPSIFC